MADSVIYDEKALLQRIAAGNTAAFKQLYYAHHERIYDIAVSVLKSASGAEDALQEVFIKIWVNREKLAEMDYFPAWLGTLLRNHLYYKLRQQARQESYLDVVLNEPPVREADPVFNEIEQRELKELVELAMQELPPQQRRAFELSRLEGLRHAEIAEQMGIAPATVKKHLAVALRQMRAFLEARGKTISVVALVALLA